MTGATKDRAGRGAPGDRRGGGKPAERPTGQKITNSATVRNGRPFAPTVRGPRGVRR